MRNPQRSSRPWGGVRPIMGRTGRVRGLLLLLVLLSGCGGSSTATVEPDAIGRLGAAPGSPPGGLSLRYADTPLTTAPGEPVTVAVTAQYPGTGPHDPWEGSAVVWSLVMPDGTLYDRKSGWSVQFTPMTWDRYVAVAQVFRADGVLLGRMNVVLGTFERIYGTVACVEPPPSSVCPPFTFRVPSAEASLVLGSTLYPPETDLPTWSNLRLEIKASDGTLVTMESNQRGIANLVPFDTARYARGNWTATWISDTPFEGKAFFYVIGDPVHESLLNVTVPQVNLNDWPATPPNILHLEDTQGFRWQKHGAEEAKFGADVFKIFCGHASLVDETAWRQARLEFTSPSGEKWSAQAGSAPHCEWEVPVPLDVVRDVGNYLVTLAGDGLVTSETLLPITASYDTNGTCTRMAGVPTSCEIASFSVPQAAVRVKGWYQIELNGNQPAEVVEILDGEGTVIQQRAILREDAVGFIEFDLPSAGKPGPWRIVWHHAGTIGDAFMAHVEVKP